MLQDERTNEQRAAEENVTVGLMTLLIEHGADTNVQDNVSYMIQ